MFRTFFTLFFACIGLSTLCQNLVPNGDFEKRIKKKCPTDFSQIKLAEPWFSLNLSTPDLFCACAGKNAPNVGAPSNNNGYQQPHSGKCYAGIICKEEAYGHEIYYREYMTVKLDQQLMKDKFYCLAFYYSLADDSQYQMLSLGALFLPDLHYEVGIGKKIVDYSLRSTIVNDTANWQKFCSIYKSYGDENYLTIGPFMNDNEKNTRTFATKSVAYYYIDDVSLIPLTDSNNCNCGNLPLTSKTGNKTNNEKTSEKKDPFDLAIDKPIALSNINFEVNKSVLTQESESELNDLAAYLHKHASYKIEIYGHTDNSGTETENQLLSEQRAEAVSEYLIKKGIAEKKISHKGFGSKNPLVPNDSEENKRKNRRVEFRLKKSDL
jgi:OmpA-OmpF porin, OOP family